MKIHVIDAINRIRRALPDAVAAADFFGEPRTVCKFPVRSLHKRDAMTLFNVVCAMDAAAAEKIQWMATADAYVVAVTPAGRDA